VTRLAEALYLLCLIAAPWPYGSSPDVARYAVAAVLLVAACLWTLDLALKGRPLPRLTVFALGLPLLALIQLALGRSAAPVWTVEAFLLLAAMLLAACFWSERGRDAAAASRLAFAVLAVCVAQSAFGAVQWSRGPQLIYGRPSPIVTTPFGSYVNHNHFAGLVEMGTLVALGLVLGRARQGRGFTPRTTALAGVALALVAAQLASRSRGGLVALAGGLLVLAALASRGRGESPRSRHIPGLALAAFVLLAFGLAVVPETSRRHLATLLSGPADTSGQYRVDVGGATLRLALARPVLGWGLGAYADAFPEFKRGHGEVRTTHAESDALELLAEAGLLGWLAAATLGVAVWRGLANRLRASRDASRNGLAMGALAAAGALAVHSLFDFNLRLPANALVFVSIVGLAAAPREDRPGLGGRRAASVVSVIGLVLAVGAAWRAAGAARLGRALAVPSVAERIARLDAVVADHPYLSEAFRARGLAWRDWPDAPRDSFLARHLRAERDLGRAIELRPHWAEPRADLAFVLAARGNRAGAEDMLVKAVALDPTHLGIGAARAEFTARTQGPPAAIEELKRLRQVNPGWPAAAAIAQARRWTKDPALLQALAATP
jgi:hypothetical protein